MFNLLTEDIIKTLFEGDEPLLVGRDGRVWKGNERLAILIERGYDMEEIKKRLTQIFMNPIQLLLGRMIYD
ncbi:MAG: hypothetical protein DRQ99_33445 [Candidatus Parabeggiatoa sp. nov. 3]|nr:MAG: hypothetical protein DRQ99_33445 [Gammaproteobacteria bacterium]